MIRNEPKYASFYGLDDRYDDINKLEQLKINYSENLRKQLNGYEFSVGISCLGYDPNMGIAIALSHCGISRWSYLSGKYISFAIDNHNQYQSATLKHSDIMEDSEKLKGLESMNSVQPGIILGRPNICGGMQGIMEQILNYFSFILLDTQYAVHRDDVAKAMIYAVLHDNQYRFTIYDNQIIKQKAKEYDEFIRCINE